MTVNLMRLVVTPLKRAASSLPPVASTWRPNGALAQDTWPIDDGDQRPEHEDGDGPRICRRPEDVVVRVWSRIGCGALLVIHMRQAASDAQHAERHEERRDAEEATRRAVDRADDAAR